VFENRVLRRIFGPKMDEVKTLHCDELNDLYCSPNISRVIKSKRIMWAGHVVRMERVEVCIQGFGGKTGGKRTIWKTKA
jgi:hypothetical protein